MRLLVLLHGHDRGRGREAYDSGPYTSILRYLYFDIFIPLYFDISIPLYLHVSMPVYVSMPALPSNSQNTNLLMSIDYKSMHFFGRL